ncbi:MAG: hypothetical protein QM775_13260 [Pirellulales bacterium]
MLPAFALAAALFAQKLDNVPPRIGYVYPPGGRAGAMTEVMIGGYDWTPDMELFVHDERVKIELVGTLGEFQMTPPPYWFGGKAGEQQPPVGREIAARITVPSDWPSGVPVRFQVANANGGSPSIGFAVSDTAEVVEPEHNASTIELPPLPATANGRLSRITEVDTYRFTTPRAGLTICRLDDQLGQPFCGILAIRDASGRIVADVADTLGNGANTRFMAVGNETYSATVAHVDHAGDRGYVYRLNVRQGPEVAAVVPSTISTTGPTTVEFIGWGLKSGACELESVRREIDPAKCESSIRSGRPDRRDLRYEFDTPAGPAVTMVATDEIGDVAEPDERQIAARTLTVPCRITGAFDELDDRLQMSVERYRIAAKKGDVFRIRVRPVGDDWLLDPSVAVVAADGAEVVRNDDLLVGVLESAVDFRCLADGEYDVVLTDASGRAPSRTLLYRLLIDNLTDAVDFDLSVPELFSVPIGGQADFAAKSFRVGAWAEPIQLRFENLPVGVTQAAPAPSIAAAPAKPGQKPKPKPIGKSALPADVKHLLTGAADAPTGSKLSTLIASATVGGRTVEHRFGPVLVTPKMPYRATVRSAVKDGGRIVHRGTTYPAEVFVDRYLEYNGPVTLMTASTQSRQRRGVCGPVVVVPAGSDRAIFPVTTPEWLETSLTTRQNLIAVVEAPDSQGRNRFVTGTMDGQIVMSIEGALLKITHEPRERIVRAGDEIEIPFKVSRSAKLSSSAQVSLVDDVATAGLFEADSIELPSDVSDALLRVRISPKAARRGLVTFAVRAEARQPGDWLVTSETQVSVILSHDSRRP